MFEDVLLVWLDGKLPVPDVKYLGEQDGSGGSLKATAFCCGLISIIIPADMF